ncbi:hypothetical protein [Streptomyces sp. NPDC006463]|uniref:hypothetical protein n=1 Tax=Streptomyces sp. NPDC006463 TaxID=3364746 RepID=UPI0036B4714A
MPRRVDWSSRADQDLARAFPREGDRLAIKNLAEAELEYPPRLDPARRADEGYVAGYPSLAFRRALARGAPTWADDLEDDPERVDPEEGPEYGAYLYVYRAWTTADAGGASMRHGRPKIYVTRFFGNEELKDKIGSARP